MFWALKSVIWGLTGSISVSYIICLVNGPLAAIIMTFLFYLRPSEKAIYPYPVVMVGLLIAMFTLVFQRKPYSAIGSCNRSDTKIFFIMQGYLMFNIVLFSRWDMLEIYQNKLIPAVLIFLLITEFIVTVKHLKILLLMISVSALLICADSLYVHFLTDQASRIWRLYHSTDGRLSNLGWWGNPNQLAYLANIGVGCLFILSAFKKGLSRLVFFLPNLVFLPTIFLTGSRGALLQLGVSGFALFMLSKKKVGTTIFVAALIFMAATYLTALSPERMYAEGSTNERVDILYYARDIFISHPIFGVGFTNFQDYNPYHLKNHNTYAQCFTEMGMVGVIILFLMLRRIFKGAYATVNMTYGKESLKEIYGLSKGIFALSAGAFTYFLFGNQLMDFIFCTIIGLLVAIKRVYEVDFNGEIKTTI